MSMELMKQLFNKSNEINFKQQLDFLFAENKFDSAIQHSKASRDGKGTVFANNITSFEKRNFESKIAIKSDSNLNYLMKVAKKERYVISNATYFGGKQNIERLSGIYYLFLDFDHVSPEQVETYLTKANNKELPLANIVELSGKGLHLYFKLENPINRCFERQKLMLSLVRSIGRKIAHAMKIADPNNTNFKYDELNLVHNHTFAGVVTKDKNLFVTSYLMNNHKFTTKELNNFTKVLSDIEESYCDYSKEVNLTFVKKEAKEPYIKLRPEIFFKYLYLLLKHKPRNNSYEGQRYKILSNFIALGKKCKLSKKQLTKYSHKIVAHFNKYNSNNPFTHSDIKNAWSRGTSIKVYQNQINRLMGKKMPFWTDGIITQKDFEKNILNSAEFNHVINGNQSLTNVTKKRSKQYILELALKELMLRKEKGRFVINSKTKYQQIVNELRKISAVSKMRFNKKEVSSALRKIETSNRRIPNFAKTERQIFKTLITEIFNKPSFLSKKVYKAKGYEINSKPFVNAWGQSQKMATSIIETIDSIVDNYFDFSQIQSHPEFVFAKNNIGQTVSWLLDVNSYPVEWNIDFLITIKYSLFALYEKEYRNNRKNKFVHEDLLKQTFHIRLKDSFEYYESKTLFKNKNHYIRRTQQLVLEEMKKTKELNQKINELIADESIFKIPFKELTTTNFQSHVDFTYLHNLLGQRFYEYIPTTQFWRTVFNKVKDKIKKEEQRTVTTSVLSINSRT